MDAASAIVEIATGCGNTEPGDLASSAGTSDTNKRKQPESVVTFPSQPVKKRGGKDRPGAGWMRGEEDKGRVNRTPWRASTRGWSYRPRSGLGPRRGHRGRMRSSW
jgi:hypothetical protein